MLSAAQRRYREVIFDESSPNGMAWRLAASLNDVGAIRSYVKGFFGEERTPSRATIADYIKQQDRLHRERRWKNKTLGYTPEDDDGEYHFQPAPELRKQIYCDMRAGVLSFSGPKTGDSENPWLQTWRMSRAVIESVCADMNVSVEQVLGRSRAIRLAKPRYVIYELFREWGMSNELIGFRVGERAHSSVASAWGKFAKYAQDDPVMARTYARHRQLMLEALRHLEATEQLEHETQEAA